MMLLSLPILGGRRRACAGPGPGRPVPADGRTARSGRMVLLIPLNGDRDMRRSRILGWVVALLTAGCAPLGPQALRGPSLQRVQADLGAGRWKDALRGCGAVLRRNPEDCAARACELVGQTMVFVDQLNAYVLPRYRTGSG